MVILVPSLPSSSSSESPRSFSVVLGEPSSFAAAVFGEPSSFHSCAWRALGLQQHRPCPSSSSSAFSSVLEEPLVFIVLGLRQCPRKSPWSSSLSSTSISVLGEPLVFIAVTRKHLAIVIVIGEPVSPSSESPCSSVCGPRRALGLRHCHRRALGLRHRPQRAVALHRRHQKALGLRHCH